MTYSIEKVTTLIGAHRYGSADTLVRWLLTDSRSLIFPEETLFFALRTKVGNGARYVDELYGRGVRSFVVEKLPKDSDTRYPNANFLVVTNALSALQRLAERHRDEFTDVPVIGITGSNGKTVVKEWLYQILLPYRRTTRSPRSYNSQLGVPLSVWLMNESTEVALFEAGISERGEMEALEAIIQPTIAIFTTLGDAHQENFSSIEEKAREKARLMHNASVVIYNKDREIIGKAIDASATKAERLCWSTISTDATFYVSHISKDMADLSTTIDYTYNGKSSQYTIPFIDNASIENSIICALTALHLGISCERLKIRMPLLQPVAMRLEVKEGQHGCTLINDFYNSDKSSIMIALDFMSRRPDHKERRRTFILSDIMQSGEDASRLYTEVAEAAAKRGVERFIGVGKEISAHSDCISIAEKHFFETTDEFIASSLFANLHDEVILLKGAREFHFEHISELLVEKVHETILEVNLNNIVANLNYYRQRMTQGQKLVCMIKADAYGAGAVEIAKTLQEHNVDYLAVALADEGVTLRKNGIKSNIIVMNPEMSSFKTLFEYDLEPEVYSFRLLEAMILAARKEGVTGYPVHVKLDTGMRRLGFDPENDIDRLVSTLKSQMALIPRSVFSHFVGSDSDDFNEFSKKQFQLFDKGSSRLQEAFPHKILRHICNSAGIEHFPERQLDMCRLGIGLYGVNPLDNSIINNVSTLKTTILQLRNVAKGESIGYSRRTILERDSVIGAIPIGYADGLDRHLGNRNGYCLVNGQYADYVGNICMDVAMIDVTGIDCKEGDTVEIFGDNLPVTVLSDKLDTIPYEVLTSVSQRVKKIYFQD